MTTASVSTVFRVCWNTDTQSILIGDIHFKSQVWDSIGLAIVIWTVLLVKVDFSIIITAVKHSTFVLSFCVALFMHSSELSKDESQFLMKASPYSFPNRKSFTITLKLISSLLGTEMVIYNVWNIFQEMFVFKLKGLQTGYNYTRA